MPGGRPAWGWVGPGGEAPWPATAQSSGQWVDGCAKGGERALCGVLWGLGARSAGSWQLPLVMGKTRAGQRVQARP